MSKKRLLLAAGSVTTIAAAGALVAGTTFGLFSSTPASESNPFAAGTVTLASDATGVCSTTSNIAPGDSGSCTFASTYSGSLSAYVALDILIETQHMTASGGAGGTNLYNPPATNHGLVVTVTEGSVHYTIPATALGSCPVGAPTGSTCYQALNELVSATPDTNGSTHTWTTAWSLPSAAGNGYQGGTAQVILTAHAVQSTNQTDAGTPGSPDATISWS